MPDASLILARFDRLHRDAVARYAMTRNALLLEHPELRLPAARLRRGLNRLLATYPAAALRAGSGSKT